MVRDNEELNVACDIVARRIPFCCRHKVLRYINVLLIIFFADDYCHLGLYQGAVIKVSQIWEEGVELRAVGKASVWVWQHDLTRGCRGCSGNSVRMCKDEPLHKLPPLRVSVQEELLFLDPRRL